MRTRHRASCVASGAQRRGRGCDQRGAGMRVSPASVQGFRGNQDRHPFPLRPPRTNARGAAGPRGRPFASRPGHGSPSDRTGALEEASLAEANMGGGDTKGGLAPASDRPGSCPPPQRRGLGPQGRCGAAGQRVFRAAVPEGLLQLLGNSALARAPLSRAGRIEQACGERRAAELLKAEQWSVAVVGGAVASAFFPKCGCGLLVLGVLLLHLSVASPVTRLVNISGTTSQARLLQIKFNECVFVSPAALHSQVEAPCLKLSKFPSFLAPTRKMPLLTPGELWHGLIN